MPKYKRKELKEFREDGVITPLEYAEFHKLWSLIRENEYRMLFTLVYFTGSRPVELRNLRVEDFKIDESKKIMFVRLHPAKKGIIRMFPLPLRYPEVKEIASYIKHFDVGTVVFPNFSMKKNPSDILYYHWKKHGVNIRPYYLRHNRFSLLAMMGVESTVIRILKGAKSLNSVTYYEHLNPRKVEEVASLL